MPLQGLICRVLLDAQMDTQPAAGPRMSERLRWEVDELVCEKVNCVCWRETSGSG